MVLTMEIFRKESVDCCSRTARLEKKLPSVSAFIANAENQVLALTSKYLHRMLACCHAAHSLGWRPGTGPGI